MPNLFTKAELDENQRKKNKLIQVLKDGEAILMAGAGCSSSLYPDWDNLMNLLHKEALQVDSNFPLFDKEKDNYLAYADQLRNCIKPARFFNVIYHCFRPKNSQEKRYEKFHQVLCRLLLEGNLKGITTTNYDVIFEDALSSLTGRNEAPVRIDKNMAKEKIFEFLYSLNKGAVPKRILHLHGVYDEEDSIVLCGSQYQEKYGFTLSASAISLYQKSREKLSEAEFNTLLYEFGLVWTQHRKLLWSLFATRRLIFMGFSLNDDYFKEMLNSVSQDLHTYGFDNHFLVLRVTDMRSKEKALIRAKELKRNYGIETVFYEEDDKNEGLANFVYELENSVRVPNATSVIQSQPKESLTVQETEPDLNQRLINLSRKR